MADLPNATETVNDGGLNITDPASMLEVVIGKASAGDLNTFTLFGSSQALHDAHGNGPGILTADDSLANGGSPIAFVRCATSVAQSIGSVIGTFTEVGTDGTFVHSPDTGAGPDLATGDVDSTGANGDHTFAILITTPGALGTMAFTIAVDGGAASAPITSAVDGVYENEATGVTITFPAGTYVDDDGYSFAVTAGGGTVTITAPGGAGTITMDMRVRIEILSDGGRGEATFRYNLDGYDGDTEAERTYSETLTVPSGGAFTISGTGLTATFADEDFYAGDLYICDVECAAPNATDVADAFEALIETETPWRFVVLSTSAKVGNATAHALLTTALQTQLDALAAESVYRAGMASTGGTTAAEAKSAYTSVTANRMLVAYGKVRRATTKPFPGMAFPLTPAIDVFASRASRSLLSTDLKRVADGPHSQIVKNFHDERVSPSGLDDIKVSTLRSFRGRGKAGFISQGRIKSAAGSDFTVWPRRLVMDVACETVHEVLVEEIGKGVRTVTAVINSVSYPGVIDPRDRVRIENRVASALASQLLTPLNAEGVPGHVSDLRYRISPTHNFLSTGIVLGQTSLVPLGYIDGADTQLGFAVALPQEGN